MPNTNDKIVVACTTLHNQTCRFTNSFWNRYCKTSPSSTPQNSHQNRVFHKISTGYVSPITHFSVNIRFDIALCHEKPRPWSNGRHTPENDELIFETVSPKSSSIVLIRKEKKRIFILILY